jgi:hypothetical protein
MKMSLEKSYAPGGIKLTSPFKMPAFWITALKAGIGRSDGSGRSVDDPARLVVKAGIGAKVDA